MPSARAFAPLFTALPILVLLSLTTASVLLPHVRSCLAPRIRSALPITTTISRAARALTQCDETLYPYHAALGAALGFLPFDPEPAALQWLKAGAHARSSAEVEVVSSGLAAARRRSHSLPQFDADLCAAAGKSFTRAQQADAVAQAGITCNLPPGPRV